MSRPVSVLLPAPGGPVIPTTWTGRRTCGSETCHGGLFSTRVIARASAPQPRPSPCRARGDSTSVCADKLDLPVEDLLPDDGLRGLPDAGRRQHVDQRCRGGALEGRERAAAVVEDVASGNASFASWDRPH